MKNLFNLYTTTAHYYDFDDREKVKDDIAFYNKLFQPNTNSILELCCGTGRITIPLAKHGYKIDGVDLSESMLSVFKSKLNKETDAVKSIITLYQQNIINFKTIKKYEFVFIPFSSFQALTTTEEISLFFACVKKHMKKDARFIIHVFNPYKKMDKNWKYAEKLDTELKEGNKIIKRYSCGKDIDTENQIIYTDLRYEITEGKLTENYYEFLKLKYYSPQQLFELLNNNGFEIINKYGYYDFSPFNETTSSEIIVSCKLALV
ncbi:MAG: class I SAM-dependent methyltransferase [Chitinophagales bacterium]